MYSGFKNNHLHFHFQIIFVLTLIFEGFFGGHPGAHLHLGSNVWLFYGFLHHPKLHKKNHEVQCQKSINLNFKNMRAPKCVPKKTSTSKICKNVIKLPKNKHRILACNFCIEKFDFLIQKSNSKLWFFKVPSININPL